jgi:hypothetical protein
MTTIALLAIVSGTATAATYSWTDDTGVVNYTDDPASIPVKFRKSAHTVDNDVDRPQAEPEKPAPAAKEETAPPAPTPARIEGKTLLGSTGDFSYYFDRMMVVVSGKAATLQYSIATLEVNEKSRERREGTLHIWCATGRAEVGTVDLPDEYIQSLKARFCSQPPEGESR